MWNACGRKLDGTCAIHGIGEWLKTKMFWRGNEHGRNNGNCSGDHRVLILWIRRGSETALRSSPELGTKYCHHK
jgi:hypothetical protein